MLRKRAIIVIQAFDILGATYSNRYNVPLPVVDCDPADVQLHACFLPGLSNLSI